MTASGRVHRFCIYRKNELKMVFHKMVTALDTNGIIYTSFKYGTFEGERSGRFFHGFTSQDTFSDFIKDVEQIRIEEEWLTDDVRPGREREKWLNLDIEKDRFLAEHADFRFREQVCYPNGGISRFYD